MCSLRQELGGAVRRRGVMASLPFVLPLNGFVSAAMTLAGLFGLAGAGESLFLVALLLPGVFTARGEISLVVLSSWD